MWKFDPCIIKIKEMAWFLSASVMQQESVKVQSYLTEVASALRGDGVGESRIYTLLAKPIFSSEEGIMEWCIQMILSK